MFSFDPDFWAIKIILAAAGIVGAVLHITFERPKTFWAWVEIGMAGLLAALFLTQPIVNFLPFLDHTDTDTLTGGGFVVGILGVFITRLLIKTGQTMSEDVGVVKAILSVFREYRKGPHDGQ